MSKENEIVDVKKVRKLDHFLNIVSTFSIVMMVVLVFYNAVLRYCFNSSLTSAEEYSRFAFVWLSYLGIILAAKEESHVSVTIVTDMLHGVTAKVVRIIKELIVLITMGIILYGGYYFTMSSNYKTAATQTNFMLVSSSVVLASAAMIIITIINLVKEFTNKDSKGDK